MDVGVRVRPGAVPRAWHTGDYHPAARRERDVEPQSGNPGAQRQVEPNRAKLLAADADQHHLFVWVDEFDAITMWAMEPERDHGPSWVPELGPGVDTLWVATRTWKPGVVVWWVTPPALWQVDLLSDALWQQHRPSR